MQHEIRLIPIGNGLFTTSNSVDAIDRENWVSIVPWPEQYFRRGISRAWIIRIKVTG